MTDESAANAAFIRWKSRHAVTWSLVNLQRLHLHPSAMSMGRPLEGRTAIVAGAGYPLTRNGEELREAQRRGATVIGVNSSAPVLRSLGVRPDAIVARESIDNSKEIAESDAPMVVLDVCAHPAMWTAAGDRCAWFFPGYPRHFGVLQRLGVRPVFGGTAAFTSAVALALEWGAARVVLVGAGLGMESVDGELVPYHPAAPRGALRGRLVDDDAVEFWGNEANDAVAEASGQRPQPRVCRIVWLPSHDNGARLPALDTLNDERDWLQTQAVRHGRRVELLNATEGGAGIVGWRNVRLADVPSTYAHAEPARFPAVYPVRERERDMLREYLCAESETLRRMCDAALSPRGPQLDALARLPALHHGAALTETLAAWRLVDAPRGDALERSRYIYGALRDAAGEAIGVLSGGAG